MESRSTSMRTGAESVIGDWLLCNAGEGLQLVIHPAVWLAVKVGVLLDLDHLALVKRGPLVQRAVLVGIGLDLGDLVALVVLPPVRLAVLVGVHGNDLRG